MAIVRDEMGTPYNWVLLKPSANTLEIFDAGSGSVMELSKVLERSAKVRRETSAAAVGLLALYAFLSFLSFSLRTAKQLGERHAVSIALPHSADAGALQISDMFEADSMRDLLLSANLELASTSACHAAAERGFDVSLSSFPQLSSMTGRSDLPLTSTDDADLSRLSAGCGARPDVAQVCMYHVHAFRHLEQQLLAVELQPLLVPGREDRPAPKARPARSESRCCEPWARDARPWSVAVVAPTPRS